MAADRDRDESGQYVAQRDPDDVLEVLRVGEPYTTSEVAKLVEWPRRSAYDALSTLADQGSVTKKQANSRMVMWIRPPEGSE